MPTQSAARLPYESIAAPYRERRDLLSFVKDVHHRRKGLRPEDIAGIAGAWGATQSEVYGIATFYSFVGTKPAGQYQVRVCRSTPCCMKHCDTIAAEVQRVLGISEGETTPDGRFSLVMVNCMGQCDGAPAMLVNDDPHRDLTVERVRQILDRYSAECEQEGEDA